jgi:hypothetical protein
MAGGKAAAVAYAAEQEMRREASEEEARKKGVEITKDKEAEITLIEQLLTQLKGIGEGTDKKPGYKNPTDIPKEKLRSTAQKIIILVSQLRTQIMALIRRDLENEERLRQYYLKNPGVAYRINKKIKVMERKIEKEFDTILRYWKYVDQHESLPGRFNIWLHPYNDVVISFPFQVIESQDMNILKEIAKILK